MVYVPMKIRDSRTRVKHVCSLWKSQRSTASINHWHEVMVMEYLENITHMHSRTRN